jgi:hypothetical protein
MQARDRVSNTAANPLPDAPDSAAGGLGQIVPKALMLLLFSIFRGAFWRLKVVFSLPAGEIRGIGA